MASSWDRVGQAASVMQVTGVDAFGLVSMIVQAAYTAGHNRDLCQQLAERVVIVADLLRKLDIPALRRHQETRRPLEHLDAALFRAYKLVRSCAQQQQNTSQLYQMFTGAEVASKLRLAQEEIDRYINLIPMITLVAAVVAQQGGNEVQEDVMMSNDAAPAQRNRLSLQQVTESLALEESPPQQSFSIEMEARRNCSEDRRKIWQQMIENVRYGLVDQVGRYLTYGDFTVDHKVPGSFSYMELWQATNGFSNRNMLDEGSSGCVYIGLLPSIHGADEGIRVAIKRIMSTGRMKTSISDNYAELLRCLRLSHPNLVQFLGWSSGVTRGEVLLVYDLMPNGCLHSLQYSSTTILSWSVRYRIILGMGDALLYLHKNCDCAIVHGNIRPSNVLFNSSMEAMLGDWHKATIDRIYGVPATRDRKQELGTCPYMAPERRWLWNWATTKTDVYSFGVILLEVASGRQRFSREKTIVARGSGGNQFQELLPWVWDLYSRGTLLEAADARLNGEFEAREMERVLIVGHWCAHPDPELRPSMVTAMKLLHCLEEPLPDSMIYVTVS